MKIKTKKMDYDQALAHPTLKLPKPIKPAMFWRLLIRALSIPAVLSTHLTCRKIGMEKLGKKEPCLFLMNHSCFMDMKIAHKVLFPRPFNIVCTTDGFVGKNWLMWLIGCIPTKKFVPDLGLVRNMKYVLQKKKSSVLMFPEASYSFDGTATTLPESLGKCVKLLGVPVVMIRTYGAFARDPLYNELQLRKVNISVDMTYLLSPEDIAAKSVEELNAILNESFTFDNFRWQQENKVRIAEPFRADGLERVLYKCPHCLEEGKTIGKGIHLTCHSCGTQYELDEYGFLKATNAETKFTHVPDWYRWERDCVRQELLDGTYQLDTEVDIALMTDTTCLYQVGSGRLVHSKDGFHLTGCDGRIDYKQAPLLSYSLYSDYFWYEIGDMLCVGNSDILYYCFPKNNAVPVAKTRLAAEELYQIVKKEKSRKA